MMTVLDHHQEERMRDLARRLEDERLLGALEQRAKAAGGDVVRPGPSRAQRRRARHRRSWK
jgi:hypothetical protein